MIAKPLFCLVGALLVCCTAVAAQTSSPSATPASPIAAATPNQQANSADAKSRAVIPPEKAKPIVIPRFDKPPVIDGKLDDEIWKQAIVLRDFHQVQPGDNIAPSKPTEVMLGYDAKFLYVAFHCFDEPDKVRANIPKRDNIFDDDYVGILFDTFNDG